MESQNAERLDADEGDAREELARRNLAAAEHACSTSVLEVEGTSTDCACNPDAPEGVVGELIDGVRVQPFSCSGATSGNGPNRKADGKPRWRKGV